jgi:hypothetical protein
MERVVPVLTLLATNIVSKPGMRNGLKAVSTIV